MRSIEWRLAAETEHLEEAIKRFRDYLEEDEMYCAASAAQDIVEACLKLDLLARIEEDNAPFESPARHRHLSSAEA